MAKGISMTRALATGQVAVASPQLDGTYESLELLFQEDTAGILSQLTDNLSSPGGSNASSQQTPEEIQLTGGQQPAASPAAEKPKRQIEARQLVLNVIHDAAFQKMHVTHVESQGEMKATGHLPGQEDSIVISGR